MPSPAMAPSSADRDAVLQQLERVLSSAVFRRAERSTALLRFIVTQTLEGRAEHLKEYTLGAEALRRGDGFDPRTDPVVRAEASRLRARLDQYYGTMGRTDPVTIGLTKGSYVPTFLVRTVAADHERQTPPPETRSVFRFLTSPAVAWGCAAAAAVSAAAAWLLPQRDHHITVPAQFEVELRSDGVLATDVGTSVNLSPDGTRLVFVSRSADGRTHLNTRALDRPDVVRLEGTAGARGPFVSPEGRRIGFWADGKLKTIATDGGSPVVLCEASDLLGASWGEDDTIVASLGDPGRLVRVPASGGTPSVVVDLTAESTVVRWPQLLPGGEFVLYTAMTGAGADRASIEVQSLRGGRRKVLLRGGTFGRYLRSGYLTYVNQRTLYAVRLDLGTLAVHGTPVPVLNDVAYSVLFGYAQVDISRTGMLVYRKDAESGRSVIAWIDRDARLTPFLSTPGHHSWMRLSPDGQRLALTTHESGITSISVYDVKTTDRIGITSQPGEYTGLTWLSADHVAFGGASGLGWVRASGRHEALPLTDARLAQTPWSSTADGRRLAYYERSADTGFDLWTVPVVATTSGIGLGTPEPYLRSRAFEVYPSFSPDGRWIAYASNESGAFEIYVRRFPDTGTKVRVSTSGGVVPRWLPHGRELVYRTGVHQVMVVGYKVAGGSFMADTPRAWSPHTLADTGVLPNFDVDPGGERILALMPVPATDQQTANHVTVLLNIEEEIRRRASSR
jgi:serine/threonine-protein kinase